MFGFLAECESKMTRVSNSLSDIKAYKEMNSKIKVIKKTDAVALKPKFKAGKTSRVAAREMVSTVSEWVADLKQRKSGETMAAVERLFGTGPQPSES
mgnify:CR=1 FL=1